LLEMVSVVFAIWPSLEPQTPPRKAGTAGRAAAQCLCVRHLRSKPRASFAGGRAGSGVDIAWHHRTGTDV